MSDISTLLEADVPYFSADDTIILPIRRAMANKQNVRIALPGAGEIYLHTERGEYLFQGKQMGVLLTSHINNLEVTLLDEKTVVGAFAGATGRNIDELMWTAAFRASGGRLMKGCFRDDVVQLRHWPNLSRLPMTPNTMRITSFLTRHPTSITLAQRLLKIEPAELYQFYSAARCAGIAHVLNRKPPEPVLKPHRNQALLGMLLNKIAGL
ncbi:MAG: hypothetical protein OEV31_09200 [Gammaproteobacteria bacterium]|nr:hypothetical protein [Gammaproteobacteria bacterium]